MEQTFEQWLIENFNNHGNTRFELGISILDGKLSATVYPIQVDINDVKEIEISVNTIIFK